MGGGLNAGASARDRSARGTRAGSPTSPWWRTTPPRTHDSRDELTAAVVEHWFDDLPVSRVDRHELPQLRALKFVMHDALGGGVTATLALDAHGKCLSSCLLALELDDPTHRERA